MANDLPLEQLLEGFRPRRLKAGELLSYPQDPDNRVFCLIRGRLRVYLAYGEKEFTLSLLGPEDIYSTHTRAYVEALEESEIRVCDLHTFAARMMGHPKLIGATLQVLARTLSGGIDTIENLAFRNVRARFACLLLGLEEAGEPHPEGILLPLALNTEQMAQMIGTSRQTLSGQIAELQREGVLRRVERGRLLLLDPARLEQLAAL